MKKPNRNSCVTPSLFVHLIFGLNVRKYPPDETTGKYVSMLYCIAQYHDPSYVLVFVLIPCMLYWE